MGCVHDELDNRCPASDMHIMVASPGPLTDDVYKNAYSFSSCSVSEMQTFLGILTQYATYLLTCLFVYLKPNAITLASSELAPNKFEAGSCQIPLH